MNEDIGWRFPPTSGGRIDGFNDPGIAHFSGRPLSSLARETIQNSLDARLNPDEPVHVSFELVDVNPDEVGRNELSEAIHQCVDSAGNKDRRVAAALGKAADIIRSRAIHCLRISDRNTSGLRGEQWRALVKMQGASFKDDLEGAGGSFGIGKYAPFAVSGLRTVFYWTCYQDGNRVTEKFQGKSVMMSHHDNNEETQGTGFYGWRKGCLELLASDIPDCFRVLDRRGRPIHGTSLGIWGFEAPDNWRLRLAASVIENYFYAIATGRLEISIEPSEGEHDDMVTIDARTLDSWFDYLHEESSTEAIRLDLARTLCDMSKQPPTAEMQDQDLGHCKLWIRVGTELPKRVAIVRRSGMLVTDRQPRLIRFDGCKEFVALVVFEDPSGNELLRGMENPRHDRFEPQRLPENDRDKGHWALHRITGWVRDRIKEHAGPKTGEKETVLSELATYLPDYRTDEPFDSADEPDGEPGSEPGIGDAVTVSLRPIRRLPRREFSTDREDVDGDGDDVGSAGGGGVAPGDGRGGGTGGPGDGDGIGGTGGKGGGTGQRTPVGIQGVRIVRSRGVAENRYWVRFRPDRTGVGRMTFCELGDSMLVERTDIRAADPAVSLDEVSMTAGQDAVLEIVASTPLLDRAWRISAELTGGDVG